MSRKPGQNDTCPKCSGPCPALRRYRACNRCVNRERQRDSSYCWAVGAKSIEVGGLNS